MGRWITIGPQRWRLARQSEQVTAGFERKRFRDVAEAKQFLRFCLGDRETVESLRAVMGGEGVGISLRRMTGQRTLQEAARLLVGGSLILWRDPKRWVPKGGGPEAPPVVAAEATAKPSPPEPEKRVEKSWIEIVLIDDSGAPVPHEQYLLELPNGATKSGVLDKNGRALINNIDPGSCKVTFPNFDGREWETARS